MMNIYAYASLALALMNAGSAFADTNSGGACGNCNGVCVTFESTNEGYYYWWNGGPGGAASTFGEKPIGSICLTDAGAMFVGSTVDGESGVATGGANTKFEWSVGATTSNFDISVCDGFSVPMTCTGFQGNESPFTTIGGGDLCTYDCPDADKNGVNCRNPGAHTGDLNQVPSCFKSGMGAQGSSGSNNYWLYDNVSVQSIFTGRSGVTCTVGGSGGTKPKRGIAQSVAELAPRASKHRHHRRAAHGHGIHAIS